MKKPGKIIAYGVLCAAVCAVASERVADADESIRDVIVREVQQSRPATPAEILTAVENLLRVDAGAEALEYLQQLDAAMPDAAILVQLHREFGSAFFLRLARDKRAAPLGAAISAQVLRAADAVARDPARVAALVAQVASDDMAERTGGLVELVEIGADAVGPLLAAMAENRERVARMRRWQATLADLGPPAAAPLVAAIRTNDPFVQYHAAVALGQIGNESVVPHLIRPALDPRMEPRVTRAAAEALRTISGSVPTATVATDVLVAECRTRLRGPGGPPALATEPTEWWEWKNGDPRGPRRTELTPPLAAAIGARQLAEDLVRLFPEPALHAQLALAAKLAVTKLENGLAKPLPGGAGSARARWADHSAAELQAVLALALRLENVPAAISAAEILGDIGTEELLRGSRGQRSVLASALRYPDRRVWFAAADAIVRVDPRTAFAGAADVAELAGYLASAQGVRRVLVVHPLADRRAALAAAFTELGFVTTAVPFARDGMRVLLADPDVECVVFSDRLTRVRWSEFLQQLSGNWRTTEIPKVVLSAAGRRGVNESLTAGLSRVVVFPEPYDSAAVMGLVQQALALAGSSPVTTDERLFQAQTALNWLLRISANPRRYGFYDLSHRQKALETALQVPELAPAAISVLGNLGTPAAQSALVSFASQPYHSAALRQAASTALGAAFRRSGVQLTGTQIQQQYARYNNAAGDETAPKILGELLDQIEQSKR